MKTTANKKIGIMAFLIITLTTWGVCHAQMNSSDSTNQGKKWNEKEKYNSQATNRMDDRNGSYRSDSSSDNNGNVGKGKKWNEHSSNREVMTNTQY